MKLFEPVEGKGALDGFFLCSDLELHHYYPIAVVEHDATCERSYHKLVAPALRNLLEPLLEGRDVELVRVGGERVYAAHRVLLGARQLGYALLGARRYDPLLDGCEDVALRLPRLRQVALCGPQALVRLPAILDALRDEHRDAVQLPVA
ncbi:hypothetical protein [uncultured Ellagibacter sp.]|uniref:hypothetical protein n=1 Tax=uncultured Ellagibacter sp. TaxID=2137580 RepID=UPI00262775A5|nr:hypothetical protein [uncultured Ellagibacter sp.]